MITKKGLGVILGSLLMGGNYCNGEPVTITADSHSVSFYPLQFFTDARSLMSTLQDLANDVINANEGGISVEGLDSPRKVESVIDCVCVSVTGGADVIDLPDSDRRKQFLALALWILQKNLYPHNIDPVIYCLNRFHEIAPTVIDKTRLLLLSQCGPNFISLEDPDEDPDSTPDTHDFIPLEDADWEIIGDAISMLKEEKNGYAWEARALLQELKDTGCYEALLEDWSGARRYVTLLEGWDE